MYRFLNDELTDAGWWFRDEYLGDATHANWLWEVLCWFRCKYVSNVTKQWLVQEAGCWYR